jgi:hypothetical protein
MHALLRATRRLTTGRISSGKTIFFTYEDWPTIMFGARETASAKMLCTIMPTNRTTTKFTSALAVAPQRTCMMTLNRKAKARTCRRGVKKDQSTPRTEPL